MTQPTDRPGIDHLTSDRLDQLYDELWHLRLDKAGADLALQAACRMTEEQRARADRHEATLERVTSLVRHYEQWGLTGWQPSSVYPSQVAREFRAVLDQHDQTTT
ncbi:hypothetical protein ACFY8P_04475 [Streptomyces sp. NPDC012693]|uniref:hypothetical protein n=1 Tax=Streptomyces sp. NPDC012693 TaxID=3364844 RepID=UPI0036797AE0